MRWAFWRREQEGSEGRRPSNRPADDAAADPAAELRVRARRRLVGAAILLLAAVIVVPMLLDSTPRPVPESVRITVATDTAPPPRAEPAPSEEARGEPAPPPTQDTPPAVPPAGTSAPPATAAVKAPAAAAPAKPGASTPAESRTAAPSGERFALQVAALSSAPAARDLAAQLKKAGFAAYTEAVSTASGTRHRVRVGPFASRDEAQRALERLRASGRSASLVAA